MLAGRAVQRARRALWGPQFPMGNPFCAGAESLARVDLGQPRGIGHRLIASYLNYFCRSWPKPLRNSVSR
jgi:hypothetical protein